jgi:hypothetical protein
MAMLASGTAPQSMIVRGSMSGCLKAWRILNWVPASLTIGGILLDQNSTVLFFDRAGPVARHEFLVNYGIAAVAAALLSAISATCFAPRRPVLARCALAWLVGALPVVLVLSLIPLVTDAGTQFKIRHAFKHPDMLPRTIMLCGAVPLASIAITALLSPIVWIGVAPAILRMHRVRLRAVVASTGGAVR